MVYLSFNNSTLNVDLSVIYFPTNYNRIMRNSLNNVDRGMNIAVINGVTGQSLRQQVFDLYGKGEFFNR